jgi:hypothetical protein
MFLLRGFVRNFHVFRRNYRVLTPAARLHFRHFELPVSDASKNGFRIHDSAARKNPKPRRQKRGVGFAVEAAQTEASKSGSWQKDKKQTADVAETRR